MAKVPNAAEIVEKCNRLSRVYERYRRQTNRQTTDGRAMGRVFCGMWIAESCQGVICGKFDADFFCGMKGKVQNETMRNVAEMNIY